MLLYGIYYIDRRILSLLAPAVSAQLHITDTQMGMLIGLGLASSTMNMLCLGCGSFLTGSV